VTEPNVVVTRSRHVTTVAINRPSVRNAVDTATARELAGAFRAFDADPEARVAVLCGEGGGFCAGADLKAVARDGVPPIEPPPADGPMGPTRLRLGKPVIAAVEGFAVAGGLELAIWCDLRVAAEDAVFGVLSRRWGVPLIDGGTVRLPRLIGLSRALDLILTGRQVSAIEAERIGLVNRVVPAGTAREAAEELAARIAAYPQECLRHDRLSALEQLGRELSAALLGEYEHGQAALEQEAAAGARRFSSGAGRHGEDTV
jgi:enoyl-CoA hydratase